ncbi:hypothetical protein [Prosthecobacter sp.]|uniref:hypothetical protein n=1 Tax=Prosthecobacter sp. TaxID=1965333 RepID=UPI003784132E
MHLRRLRTCFTALPALLLALAAMPAAEPRTTPGKTAAEPDLPRPIASEAGYFPTLSESALLRGPSNSRSLGGALNEEEGPDLRKQNATGLFPYEDSSPNFYQRNQNFFKPLDHTLGWATANNALTYELDSFDNTSFTLDGRLGFLTRQFAPELAMLKAGPLYLDVLWLGTGVVWSDYNGSQNTFGTTRSNRGDGTIAYIDAGVRGLLRLTDTIYFSVVGNIMYLPMQNKLALRFGNGNTAGLLTRLNYSETFGAWDLLIYDEFQARPGLNYYGQLSSSGIDRAGRYSFGFQSQGSSNQFYNENYVIFYNKLALTATRLVFDNQWRFGFGIDHTDFWRTFSFSNHTKREHIGFWLGYEGSVIPFAPRLTYDILSYDSYRTLWHRAFLDFTGRLTENINWGGRLGTALSSGGGARQNNPFLWQIDLDHTITRNTRHWIRFGENIFDNPLTNESLLSRFVGWGIDQRLDRRLHATAFLQYADSEVALPSMQRRRRSSAGFTLRYHPLDFTQIIGTTMYERITQAGPGGDVDRWLYRLEVTQQLGLRLTGNLFYQYEDRSAAQNGFSEHVIGISLRRYF